MKMKRKVLACLIPWVILLLSASPTLPQGVENEDKTLSPYFFIKNGDPEVDSLPLKSTSAKVNVAGVIADVTVTQIYENEGKKPLEAIYVFPASTRAAVYGMKMTIGERTIIAKIREREQARREYEQAKQEGKSASLLEQQRPNVFQMNVANILPKDVIKVELRYTELLLPTDGIYEFVYPTVVGPRYSNQPASTAPPSETFVSLSRTTFVSLSRTMWTQNPYLHEGEPPTYTFDIQVSLAAGLPVQEVTCPSHKVRIQYAPSSVSVQLDPSEKNGGNRDYFLKYRLAGGKVESGLLLYTGEKENFFLLMMQPPKRVTASQIPPREYIFIVDVSGSMHGFPLEISKKLLRDLISRLRPTDTFNVLLFAGGSSLMSEQSVPASPQNIQHAIQHIEQQQGGGGTELLPALKRALSVPRAEGTSRTVVIATDGYVTVEEEAFDLIRNHLGDGNFFPFGIGSSVNRYLIEGMARVGMGEPFVIYRPEGAQAKAEEFRKLIESPVLTRIKVDFGKFDAYEVEPPAIPDLLAQRPIIVFGKWHGRPQGEIILRGMAAGRPYAERIEVGKVMPQSAHSAIRYLWARHRIALLGDYNRLRPDDGRVKEITRLGLTYNLLTAYTSFVAIDTQIRVKNGQTVTVKQPLPLPEGVSDLAVGEGSVMMKGSRAYAPALAPAGSMMADQSLSKMEGLKEKEAGREEDKKNGKPSSGPGQLRLGELVVTGGLSKEEVQKILQRELSSFQLCFQEALKAQPNLKGKMIMKFTIDARGRVSQAKVSESELKATGKEWERCIRQRLLALQFPAPAGGVQVIVTVPFILN